ncbi:leucine-rich repeat protein [Paenibacillus sp. IB182496]|uniref:Leucine-rich repeat protein n=1 Tax=Paenibacillus sabuli TaxID=2772509 RepID=A0A927BTB0_9BACL|nr:leucine-rich repeat protein [Paenibacillus sabuli]MBD2846402.1 leucine-rich repeat protein [Paenibacillus sabuli]
MFKMFRKWGKLSSIGLSMLIIVALISTGGASTPWMPVAQAGPGPLFETSEKEDGTLKITGYNGTETELEIPGTIDDKTVSEIGAQAFFMGNLTSVTIPKEVVAIGSMAFAGNQLTSVTIPGNVKVISSYAFQGNLLTSVTLEEGVQTIEGHAFMMNSLTSITIPESVIKVGTQAFAQNMTLTSVNIEGNDELGTQIEANAFNFNGNVTSVTLGEGVTSIGDYAFSGNKLTSLTIPGTVTSIGNYAFTVYKDMEGLERLTMEEGVEEIGDSAFFGNQLTHVTIPHSVQSVGMSAFLQNRLERVTFEGMPTLKNDVFKQNYTGFDGWYSDAAVTEEWTDQLSAPVGGELYAKTTWPASPTSASAEAGDAQAIVNFTAPAYSGDSAITGYTVRAYVDGVEQTGLQATGEASPITVTGLTNGTAYTFEVIATNAAGDSLASAASSPVTPVRKPEASVVSIRSSNADASRAKVGDTITLDITTSKAVIEPAVTIAGNVATVSDKGDSDATTWSATYTLQESDEEGAVAFTADFEDTVGTVGVQVTTTTDGSSVTLDKTAPAAPEISIDPAQPTNQNVTVTISYPEDAATASYKLGDGSWQLYSAPFEVATNLSVYARAIDAAGNMSTTTSYVVDTIYKSEPVITLIGQEELNHEAATPYTDAGAIAADQRDQDLTAAITVTGAVYTDELGTYVLRYNVSDSTGNPAAEVTRTVHVVDTTAPTLTLNGDQLVTISQGSSYVDAGAVASDTFDGDLSGDITVDGTVDTAAPGEYTLVYRVSDASGNAAEEVSRTVQVLSNDASLQALDVDPGALAPAFDSQKLAYTVRVSSAIDQINLSLTVSHPGSVVELDGELLALDDQGGATAELEVAVGKNAFVLTVKAADGTEQAYSLTVNRAKLTPVYGGEGPVSPTPNEPESEEVDIWINGSRVQIGKALTDRVNDREVTTVAVDETLLAERLEAEGKGATIIVPVNTGSEVTIGELTGRMVKAMEAQEAVVELRTDKASYTLPAGQINIDSISERFGSNLALEDIKINIMIEEPQKETVQVVEDAANAGGLMLVVPPMSFSVQAKYGDRTEEVTTFNAYVERTLALPEGVDASRVTTGVVVDPDGNVRHVPTKIVEVEGTYYAQINSLTNSTYAVVWSPVAFEDVTGHWAMAAVNNMGSRMIISGVGEDRFEPDREITRAEFAAIVVRGLGLKVESGSAPFTDVHAEKWYHDAVYTAYSHDLISGYQDGTFRPNATITREEAMVMISKAMGITGLAPVQTEQAAREALHAFEDGREASEWAVASIAANVEAGIVSGRSDSRLAPKASITRAEVALIIQRLLQKSERI